MYIMLSNAPQAQRIIGLPIAHALRFPDSTARAQLYSFERLVVDFSMFSRVTWSLTGKENWRGGGGSTGTATSWAY